ncbi:MAG: hypothetical protein ACYS29_09555, partial [Planctomycetota bacterium]
KQFGRPKQTVFKILKRLGIEPKKHRDSLRGNQRVSYITQAEFKRLSMELAVKANLSDAESSNVNNSDEFISAEQGVFYLVQLEPEHDPDRFKVGFAANMRDRLRALRCSAPFATVVKTWPCRRLWEKTVIDCVTSDCEQLRTEVFRTECLDDVRDKCERFFDLMPTQDISAN